MTIPLIAPLRLAAAVAALALAAACGSDLTLPDQEPPEPRLSLTVQGGDGQEGTVGEPLETPLAVRVTADGEPLAGRAVAFEPVGDAGALAPDTTLTDATGRASARWTLGGVPGDQEAVARLVFDSVLVRFTARASVGAARELAMVSGDDQSGAPNQPLPAPLVVRVTDRFGNPVPGVEVEWEVRQGRGSVDPGRTVTDEEGLARTSWTLGFSVTRQRVHASAGDLDGSPVEFGADIF